MMRNMAIAVAASVLIVGCTPDGAAPTDTPTDEPSYASPPVASGVESSASGSLVVSGVAGPDERVRLIQMDGTAHGVTADGAGAFAVAVPGGAGVDRLFNLSVERAGQSVSSDGWLFSPAAAPERAVMLRSGGASLPVGPAPLLAVIDMDNGGGVAAAGLAQDGETVSLSVDGRPSGSVRAGPDGRWFLVLSSAVSPGPHQITASVGDRRDQRSLDLSPVRPEGALEAHPVEGAVRVAWALPAGGSQTTWILLPQSD